MQRFPLERKSQSSFKIGERGWRYHPTTQYRKIRNRDEADPLVAALSKMFYNRQFAYSDEKQAISASIAHCNFYGMRDDERKELGCKGYPNWIGRAHMITLFKEMGVMTPTGRGKQPYKVTILDDWRVVIDRGKFVRVTHFHEGGEAWRANRFTGKDKETGETVSLGWKCIKCQEPEPLRVKGFVMLHTIGGDK